MQRRPQGPGLAPPPDGVFALTAEQREQALALETDPHDGSAVIAKLWGRRRLGEPVLPYLRRAQNELGHLRYLLWAAD